MSSSLFKLMMMIAKYVFERNLIIDGVASLGDTYAIYHKNFHGCEE